MVKCSQIDSKSDGNVKKNLFAKKVLRSLEVVFDLCEKGLMRMMRDGNANDES